MTRILAIISLVGLLMATGMAGASPVDQVRLPITVPDADEPKARSTQSVTVKRGDHLWKISARHLGEEATNSQIAPYWRVVVDVNTPHLRSGDPDLIFPGEMIELPEWTANP